MAYAFNIYSAGSSQTDYTIAFPYIKEEHVKVYVNFVDTSFTFHNATTARLSSAPASGTRVEVRRVTPPSAVLVDYADGSTLTASDLDTSNLQHLYLAQEEKDNNEKGLSISATTGLPTLNSQRLTNVADPTGAQDAVTKAYLERTGSITSTQIANGTIVNDDIANTTITAAKIVNDTITGTQIAANAIGPSELSANSVGSSELADDAVDRAAILNDAVNVTKLPGFKNGSCYVQDTSAQLAALLISPKKGELILDACSAPGGKATHLAELCPEANIIALDSDKQRLSKVQENLDRFKNHNITIQQGDARDQE